MCRSCKRLRTTALTKLMYEYDILNCLPEMQASVFEDSIAALVYIVGYLTAKSKNEELDDSHFYYVKYGDFRTDLNEVVYIYFEIPYVSE